MRFLAARRSNRRHDLRSREGAVGGRGAKVCLGLGAVRLAPLIGDRSVHHDIPAWVERCNDLATDAFTVHWTAFRCARAAVRGPAHRGRWELVILEMVPSLTYPPSSGRPSSGIFGRNGCANHEDLDLPRVLGGRPARFVRVYDTSRPVPRRLADVDAIFLRLRI